MAKFKKQILIVDDEPAWIKVLSVLLRREGYNVLEATSGKEALRTLTGNRPDLILSDVRMPDMNGFDFLDEVRRTARNSKIPVVFLTGIDDYDAKKVARDLGATDYLIKPFDEHDVLSILSKHLKLK
jgi:two-component system sensor histidine kinase/response regulator